MALAGLGHVSLTRRGPFRACARAVGGSAIFSREPIYESAAAAARAVADNHGGGGGGRGGNGRGARGGQRRRDADVWDDDELGDYLGDYSNDDIEHDLDDDLGEYSAEYAEEIAEEPSGSVPVTAPRLRFYYREEDEDSLDDDGIGARLGGRRVGPTPFIVRSGAGTRGGGRAPRGSGSSRAHLKSQ